MSSRVARWEQRSEWPLAFAAVVFLLRVLNRRATDSPRGKVAIYVGGATLIVLFCASLAVLDAERRNPHANITNFGDALWWATTTVATVGYGDHYPITTEGRFVAVGLMLAGIALIGVVTASLASWQLDRVRDQEREAAAVTNADISALRVEIEALRRQLGATGDRV